MDEFDELEIETIAAAQSCYADDDGCGGEQQIDEYCDYSVAAAHHLNTGCGCVLPIITTFLLAVGVSA